jgi:hypothetical protein
LSKAGVAGLKVDFLDHEAKEVIDLYQDILRDAAEFKLVINFHGANKPAGEARTWPKFHPRRHLRPEHKHQGMGDVQHDVSSPACSRATRTTAIVAMPPRNELGAPDRERRDSDVAVVGLWRPPVIAAVEPGGGHHQDSSRDMG